MSKKVKYKERGINMNIFSITVLPLLFVPTFLNACCDLNSITPPIGPTTYTFEEDCQLYGITVGGDWKLHYMNNNPRTFQKLTYKEYDKKELQYQTDIQHVLLRYKTTNTYFYLCRAVLSPVCKKRDTGFMGIGSKCDNWYFKGISISLDFSKSNYNFVSFGDWYPKTQAPQETTNINIGVNASNDSLAGSINFGFSVNRGLEITSLTNVATKHFETKFYYTGTNSDYNHNSAVFETGFKFSSNGKVIAVSSFPEVKFETYYYGKEYFKLTKKNYTATLLQDPRF